MSVGFGQGLIKHTHHDMDVDKPGKDSYELRKAGGDTDAGCQSAALGVDD